MDDMDLPGIHLAACPVANRLQQAMGSGKKRRVKIRRRVKVKRKVRVKRHSHHHEPAPRPVPPSSVTAPCVLPTPPPPPLPKRARGATEVQSWDSFAGRLKYLPAPPPPPNTVSVSSVAPPPPPPVPRVHPELRDRGPAGSITGFTLLICETDLKALLEKQLF